MDTLVKSGTGKESNGDRMGSKPKEFGQTEQGRVCTGTGNQEEFSHNAGEMQVGRDQLLADPN